MDWIQNPIIPEIPWDNSEIGQSMGPRSPKREDGFRSGLGISILGILFHIVGKEWRFCGYSGFPAQLDCEFVP